MRRICQKHFYFSWNVIYIKELENVHTWSYQIATLGGGGGIWKIPNHKRDMAERLCILQIPNFSCPPASLLINLNTPFDLTQDKQEQNPSFLQLWAHAYNFVRWLGGHCFCDHCVLLGRTLFSRDVICQESTILYCYIFTIWFVSLTAVVLPDKRI